jgi:hypothetical protein
MANFLANRLSWPVWNRMARLVVGTLPALKQGKTGRFPSSTACAPSPCATVTGAWK